MEGELQFEPCLRILQGVAEQLTQLRRPVAHGLRVDAELCRHRGALAQKRPHKPTLFVHEYSGEFAQWVEAKTLELFC